MCFHLPCIQTHTYTLLIIHILFAHHAESAIKFFRGILGASEKDYQETFEAGIKKDLESKIKARLKDIATTSEELTKANSVIEEAKKAIRNADKESQRVEREIASIRRRLRDAYTNLAKLTKECEDAEKKFKEAEVKLKEEDKKLQKIEKTTAKLQDSVAEYESLPDDASCSDITTKQGCLNDERKDLLEEMQKLVMTTKSVQCQKECANKAEEELNKAKKRSEKEMKLIEEKEEKCESLVQSSRAYSSESAEAKRKLEEATSKDLSLKEKLERAVDGVNAHVKELHGYFERLITRLNTLIEGTMGTIKSIKAKMEEMAKVEFDKMGMRLQ